MFAAGRARLSNAVGTAMVAFAVEAGGFSITQYGRAIRRLTVVPRQAGLTAFIFPEERLWEAKGRR
jgi:hypothetical protein